MGELLAIINAAFFAVGGIFIRRGAAYMDREVGFLISVYVNTVINGLIWAVHAWTGPPIGFSWAGLIYFVIGGAGTTLLGRWFWFRTIVRLGPSRAGTFKTAQTLFVVAIALTFMGEHASLLALAGGACILGGLYTLSTEEQSKETTPEEWRAGVMTGWVSAAFFATGNLARKLGMNVWPDALTGAMLGSVAALVCMMILPANWTRTRQALRLTREHRPWNFVIVGVVTSGSHLALYYALERTPVWVVNLLQAVEPMILPFLSIAMLREVGREVMSRRFWVSISMVVAGVAMIALR